MDKLKRALDLGYLLHGSPHLITRLEPRQAQDDAKTGGNQCGVYATTHPVFATWRGILHKGESCRTGWSWNDNGAKILFAEGQVELGDGYVYILPRDSFQIVEGDSTEYVSYDPVTPIQVVKVTRQDLLDLQSEFDFKIDIR